MRSWSFSGLRNETVAVCLTLSLAAAPAWAVCGDGHLNQNEECDPGGVLHINGDPSLRTCTSGTDCFYEYSCCKFNCQYVGSGAPCNDADPCTGADTCDQLGVCRGTADSPNGTPCDDGVFCNGTESCTGGVCGSPSGDPCPGTACNTCQEATDSCFDPAGAPCESGSACLTGTCDGAGTCDGTPNSAPCDDGVFCNGADTCAAGGCSLHSGDPCAGGAECADHCDESADNCYAAAGTPCTDDGNACTDDACDGAGACAATANSLACDDGVFCNGTDTCAAGTCSQHAGDPCPDEVACTVDTCDEEADSCSNTPQDASCDDGLFCDGAEVCDPHGGCRNGVPPCNDDNSCTVDTCVEAQDSCSHDPLPEYAACDDGSLCTIGDQCTGGLCVGQPPLLVDLCPWTVVVREDPRSDRIKTYLQAQIDGDMCAAQLFLGASTLQDGDVVALKDSGRAAICTGLFTEIGGDIVSGGGGGRGRPSGVKLPYTADLAVMDGGTVVAKTNGQGLYDLSGGHPRLAACTAARRSYDTVTTALDALPSDLNVGEILMRKDAIATLEVPNPGGLNIIDVASVRGASGTALELDGGGDPATALLLRVRGSLQIRNNSAIVLTGGLLPQRVLIYVAGRRCDIGIRSEGAGTLFCPAARIRVGYDTLWTGAWYAGARLARIGERVELTYEPFRAF